MARPVPGQTSGPQAAPRSAEPPRLLDRVRTILRARHYSPRTEESYVAWIRRYIVFHGRQHPAELGETDVASF